MSAESGSLRPCPLGTARGTVGPDALGASALSPPPPELLPGPDPFLDPKELPLHTKPLLA